MYCLCFRGAVGAPRKKSPPFVSPFFFYSCQRAFQRIILSQQHFSYDLFQFGRKKEAESKIEEGVLRSFWKRQKSIREEILPGSYTSIFFSTFVFHRFFCFQWKIKKINVKSKIFIEKKSTFWRKFWSKFFDEISSKSRFFSMIFLI